jgi:hypothetical protein
VGHGYYVFSRVVTRPARPNKYTYYYTKLPDPLSPSFSFLLCYSLTSASPSLSPSFTLSLFPLFHRQASSLSSFLHGLTAASSPARSSCLFSLSAFAWGRARRHGVAQIRWDLTGSGEISLDLTRSSPIR